MASPAGLLCAPAPARARPRSPPLSTAPPTRGAGRRASASARRPPPDMNRPPPDTFLSQTTCQTTCRPRPAAAARPGQVPPAERSGVTHGQRAQSLAGRCARVPDQHSHSRIIAVRSRGAGTSPEPVPATLGPDGALGSPSMPPEIVVTRSTHDDDSFRRSTQVVL